MYNLIKQNVLVPIRSGMYGEGDHACEYELDDGFGPFAIHTFPETPGIE